MERAAGRIPGQIVTLIYISFHYQIDFWPRNAVTERVLKEGETTHKNI
jgi:hypothetical protein